MKSAPFTQKFGHAPEYIGRKLNERFDEEAPLYRYGPARRTAVLTKAFESSECQSYYK